MTTFGQALRCARRPPAQDRAGCAPALGSAPPSARARDTPSRRLRPNTLAGYRLRVRDLRVYYDVVKVPAALVLVQAIGIKVRNRVMIGGEEIDLT